MANVLETIRPMGSNIYYTDKFRNMLEDHLHILKRISSGNIKIITQNEWADLYRYEGDFYGLFRRMGYQDKYHWTILRLNSYRSRFDLKEELDSIIYPDFEYVDNLANYCKQK